MHFILSYDDRAYRITVIITVILTSVFPQVHVVGGRDAAIWRDGMDTMRYRWIDILIDGESWFGWVRNECMDGRMYEWKVGWISEWVSGWIERMNGWMN